MSYGSFLPSYFVPKVKPNTLRPFFDFKIKGVFGRIFNNSLFFSLTKLVGSRIENITKIPIFSKSYSSITKIQGNRQEWLEFILGLEVESTEQLAKTVKGQLSEKIQIPFSSIQILSNVVPNQLDYTKSLSNTISAAYEFSQLQNLTQFYQQVTSVFIGQNSHKPFSNLNQLNIPTDNIQIQQTENKSFANLVIGSGSNTNEPTQPSLPSPIEITCRTFLTL